MDTVIAIDIAVHFSKVHLIEEGGGIKVSEYYQCHTTNEYTV